MDSEMLQLIRQLLADNSIGTYPTRVNNGADYYTCPACGSYKNVKGHIGGMGPLSTVDHTPRL